MSSILPGYKMTEVGLIPEDWKLATLQSLCVSNGLVRGPFGGTLKKEFFVKSGYKVYEQRNAIYRNIETGAYFVDDSKFRELIRFTVRAGDFIVSCSGTIGRIYQIPQNAPEGVINQALLKITTDPQKVNDTYFYKYFEWDMFQKRIFDNTHGGAMQNLVSMDVFRNVLIPIPPTLAEQRTIANALSEVDTKIIALDETIAKKHDLKQGAMQRLLTGEERLPGFSGEWKTINLADSSTLKARIGWQGLTTAEYLESGDYYLITGTDFLGGRVDWEHCHFVDHSRYEQDKNIQMRVGDVLITKDGTIGKVAYIDYLPNKATLNSGIFVIRPSSQEYVSLFLYYILHSRIFDEFLAKLQAGSTINHLYQKDFVDFKFNAPHSLEEQQAIAQIFYDIDAEIITLELQREKIVALKQGMMQELLTGKTRLV